MMASVCMDLMKHRSSTTVAVCGSRSLTHAPDCPRRANANFDGTTGNVDCDADMPVSRKEAVKIADERQDAREAADAKRTAKERTDYNVKYNADFAASSGLA